MLIALLLCIGIWVGARQNERAKAPHARPRLAKGGVSLLMVDEASHFIFYA